jgi:hypothetical protein
VPEFLYRVCDLFPSAGVPGALLLPMSAGECLQAGRCFGDVRLCRHQRRASKHPRHPEKLVSRRRVGALHQTLQPVEALTGLERKEISGTERVRHDA